MAQRNYSVMSVEDYLILNRNSKDTRYPRVVVEVLSPTTEATDRGKKAAYHRACPTIQEYVMVDSEEIFVEVHRREEERWTINTFEPGDTITLESFGIQFPIEDAYEGTSLTNES